MWKDDGPSVPIEPSQVVVGLYVWLDVPWADHPFLTSRVMVRSARDVALLQGAARAGKLFYYPARSTTQPAPARPSEPAPKAELAQEIQALRDSKRSRMQAQNGAAARLDKEWEEAARATREALLNLARSPRSAGEQLQKVSGEAAHAIALAGDVLRLLLCDKAGKGPQFHALSTMTLCLLLGKHTRMPERELADLALAALAHDAGMIQVPAHIVQSGRRKKFEEDFYRQHVQFSLDCARQSGVFSPEALAAIAEHHECLDGSGWPTGRKDLSAAGRILAIVECFETLCTPEAQDVDPMMPAEALAHMFRFESARFDPALLGAFIKLLGVYPPGTVVQLSDESIALVVAPGPNSLQPRVLVYSPDVPRSETLALELWNERELKVVEAVRPTALPPEVRQWINLQDRLSYCFSTSDLNA